MTSTEKSIILLAIQKIEGGNPDLAVVLLKDLLPPETAAKELWLLEMAPDVSSSPTNPWKSWKSDGKIETLKVLRKHLDLGLAEAKALIESLPKNLGVHAPDAPIVRALAAIGAKTEGR